MRLRRRPSGEAAIAGLSEVIGEDAAFELARRFGGTKLYIPKTIGAHHPIAVAIGEQAAASLAEIYGLDEILIPKQIERQRRVRQLAAGGRLTRTQIARETNYSERHVYRLLNPVEDDRQPSFFDEEDPRP